MKKKIVIVAILVFFLSGCVEKEILDDISLETARAYDYIDKNKILGTSLVYSFQPDKSIKNLTLSTEGSTTREVITKLQRQAAEPLSEGSLELFLFDKKLAKEGLIDLLDAPIRNPSIGARLYLAVVEDEAKALLEGEFSDRGNAIFISNLLEHNIKRQNLPKTNLQLFFHDYYQLGKTEYLPQLKKVSNESIEITGISLFSSDKIRVVDTLEPNKMFFFKLLVDKFTDGAYTIELGKDSAVLRTITSKTKMKITKRNPYEITVNIKIKGVVEEYTGYGTVSGPVLKKYEKALEEQTTKECEEMIARFKEKHIDPVGFGFFIKTKTRGFKGLKDWEDSSRYQNLTVKVNTDVQIIETGVIE
jgi:spore germination protein